MPLSKAQALKVLLSIDGTYEKPYFGHPAVFYGDDYVGRAHQKEEGVVLRVGSIEMRDVMLEAEPKLFYITDHYKAWPLLLARLTALDTATLRDLVRARIGEIEAKKAKKKKKAPAAKKKAATRKTKTVK